jgi:hypothetical protein
MLDSLKFLTAGSSESGAVDGAGYFVYWDGAATAGE